MAAYVTHKLKQLDLRDTYIVKGAGPYPIAMYWPDLSNKLESGEVIKDDKGDYVATDAFKHIYKKLQWD